MNNFIAKYFNTQKGEPLQIDEEGLFMNSLRYLYNHKYIKNSLFYTVQPSWSGWTYLSARELLSKHKKEGDSITIFDTKRKIDKEEL